MRHLRFPAVLLPSLLLVLASCSAASPSASAVTGTTIDVALQEWAVIPAVASTAAGEVTFHITNDGPADVHEFVVMKTDLDPADLPTAADGSVDEAGGEMEVIDEIEDIPVGESMDLTVTLAAGSYILLCNIYTADEDEAHYEMGMRTAFTVE
ncbi:MAG TPA: hypothetical protein VEW45_07375 [Candidatus Dormibacteraeota bacterium]|nr:hypothetical protein [Candidatus Dormibacteraeota bacterium]